MKKILLVNHGFPPNDGIGGRRWAKFSKYLAQKGYEIHVILADFHTDKKSPWQKDVDSNSIVLHPLPLNYPFSFFTENKNIFKKIKFRTLKYWYSLTTQKRIYDKTFLWEKQFINKAEEIVRKHDIKNIIVTGAPFYLLYYTALLADKIPNLNIIGDYRDPWLGAANYGMNDLSEKRKAFEQDLQNKVAEKFSFITAPNKFMLSQIEKSITINHNCKFLNLPHVYDMDDFEIKEKPRDDSQVVTFVYGGAIYIGLNDYLPKLNKALDEIKINNPLVYQKLRFEFYTSDTQLLSIFKDHSNVVFLHPSIGNAIFQKVKDADFCMILLAWHNKDYLTTKAIEFMSLRKPFLYLGDAGYVAQFINENKMGQVIDDTKEYAKQIVDIVEKYNNNASDFNATFDVSIYSAENVVNVVEKMLV